MRKTYMQKSLLLAVLACLSAEVWAGEGVELKTETERTSYALGYQIGGDFARQRVEINDAAVLRGIADARAGAAPMMSEEAMHATLIELKRKVVEQERAATPQPAETPRIVRSAAEGKAETPANVIVLPHARRATARSTEGSREFMEKNAHDKGVVTLPSGVQYRVLKEGSGKQPRDDDKVALIYRGTLINGNEFGNTDREGKPAARTFPLTALVPGMREAVSHMSEGSKWQVFIPPQLGFDASTPLYRKVTVFDVELVAVNP